MESLDLLKKIYAFSADRRGERVPVIERYLGIEAPSVVTVDDHRNEPEFYRELAQNNEQLLEGCLRWLFRELRMVPYERSDGIFAGVEFLQSVLADVLWRYGLRVAEHLERFTRVYDRLDVADERRKLYEAVREGEIFD